MVVQGVRAIVSEQRQTQRPDDPRPCEACRHFRRGTSVSTVTLNSVLPAVRSVVQSTHLRALQEEAARVGARQREADDYSDLGIDDPDTALDTYSWRPTEAGYPYCGVAEFDGVWHITQIKNFEQRCTDFVRSAGAADHSCETCEHLIEPVDSALREIERCTVSLNKGSQLLTMIKSQFEQSAPTVYQSCIDGLGVLASPPGVLPWCRAWSEDGSQGGSPRYVVGPVVNVGKSCPRWERRRGGPSAVEEQIGQLRTRWEQQRRQAGDTSLWMSVPQRSLASMGDYWFMEVMDSNSQTTGGQLLWADALQWSSRWAASELIAFCLQLLGADPGFIATIRDSIAADNPPLGTRDEEMIDRINSAAQREPQAAAMIVPKLAGMHAGSPAPPLGPPRLGQHLAQQQPALHAPLGGSAGQPGAFGVQPTQMSAAAAYEAGVAADNNDDLEAAEAWYRQAAERGHIEAAHSLGVKAYFHDLDEAVRWWRWAAERGNMDSVSMLAGYCRRDGPTRDLTEALRWLRVLATDPNPKRSARARREIAEVEAELQEAADDDEDDGEELLTSEQVASLNRMTDMRTPLTDVFSETEIAMLTRIPDADQRRQQEIDMRAYKARALRETLENLASMRRQMMQMLGSGEDGAAPDDVAKHNEDPAFDDEPDDDEGPVLAQQVQAEREQSANALHALLPNPPGTVTAARDRAGTTVIRWTPSETLNVTYRVSRRNADGSLHVVGRTPGTSLEDGGASPGPGAEYVVVALQAGRTSAEVSTAVASVAAVGAPSNVTARRTSGGHVLVAWDGPDGAEFKVSRVLPDGRQQAVGRTRHRSIEDGGAPAELPGYVVVAIRDGVRSPSVST